MNVHPFSLEVMVARKALSREDEVRIQERRRQILPAAAALFARRGYHRARLQEIADEAGVAAGTIYNYFKSKEDLLLALLAAMANESIPTGVEGAGEAEKPEAQLAALLRDRLAMLDRNRELIKAVAPEMIVHDHLFRDYLERVVVPMLEHVRPLFQRAAEAGLMRPFNQRVIFPAIMGAIIGAFAANEHDAFPGGDKVTLEELAAELVAFILDGVRAREAKATEGMA